MSSGERLVKTLQKMARPFESDITDLVIGTVTSIEPLKIKIDKVELTESFLILSAFVQETIITGVAEHKHSIDGDTSGEAGGHSHTYNSQSTSTQPPHSHSIPGREANATTLTIKLWDGLKLNDAVYLLRCSGGQKYFVLQKIGGIV